MAAAKPWGKVGSKSMAYERLALAVRLGIAILPLYPEDVVNQSALRKKTGGQISLSTWLRD